MGRNPEVAHVKILTAGVGAGHTYFGQTLERPLTNEGIAFDWYEALQDARDMFSKIYWTVANAWYYQGSQGPIRNAAYEWSRTPKNVNNPVLKLAQREIRRELAGFDGVVISTHAHTAIKEGKTPLIVVQGDFRGGKDYAIAQADCIVVPEEASRDELVGYGVPGEKIAIVGYFVDERVKNSQVKQRRLEQLREDGKPHVGIYLTGARPAPHVRLINQTLLPNLALQLREKRIQLTIYTTTDEKLSERFLSQARALGLTTTRFCDEAADGNWDVQVLFGRTPREANDRALTVLGDPQNPISILVTMIGERLGWASGVALVPLDPINRTNAGGNTKVGIARGLFAPPLETSMLPDRLRVQRDRFRTQILKGEEHLDPNGAENTVAIVKKTKLPY